MTDMFIAPGTPNANQSYGGAFGNDFQITGDTYVNSYLFYYDPAHSSGYPTRLSIWNRTNSLRLWTTTSLPTAPSTAGWVTVAVSPQLTLTDTSKTYQCCQTALWFWGWTSGAPSVASGFTGVAPKFQNSEPGTLAGGWVYNAEYVGTANTTGGNGGSSGSTGEGAPTFTGDLEAWESSDSTKNLHQSDGLPWLTKTVADAIQVVTDKLGASGSGNSLNWIASLWRLAGDLTDAEIGLLKSLLTRQGQITGASGGGGSAFYGPSGTQVSAGVETLLGRSFTLDDLGTAIALLRERLDLSPDLADTTRWTLVDTIDGEADALVNVQADAYFLNLTTIPSGHPQMGIAATLWVPRWGWASPRVHAHFRQRQFTDLFPAVFTTEGLFMDGILIHALPGFEWTCECYTLDRS